MFYFAPINTPNNNLKAGASVIAEIVGIDSMHNQIWFDNKNAHLVNITFKCQTGEIIVQKEQVTLNELGNIAKLYKATTGKDIDPNVGFSAKEITLFNNFSGMFSPATLRPNKAKIGFAYPPSL